MHGLIPVKPDIVDKLIEAPSRSEVVKQQGQR